MADFVSAVDDGFNFTPQAECAAEVSDDNILKDAYNTPHQGHWEVASGVESFVDARCAAIHGYRPSYTLARPGLAIDQGLAKRFMQATFEEKRSKVPTQQDNDRKKTVSGRARASPVAHSERKPKAFVVPPLQHRPGSPPGHDIEGKASPASATPTREQKPETPVQNRTPIPSTTRSKPSIVPGRSPQSQSRDRVVQILGKNGEQALVRLPLLRSFSSGTKASQNQKQTSSTVASTAKAHSRRSKSQATVALKKSSGENLNQPKSIGREKTQESIIIDAPVGKSPHRIDVVPGPNIASKPTSIAKSLQSSPKGLKSGPGSCKDSGIAMSIDSKVRLKAASGISEAAFSIAEKIAHLNCTAKALAAAPSSSNTLSKRSDFLGTQHPSHQQSSPSTDKSRTSATLRQGNGSKVGTLRSNYKPPTVRSGSSSSSVVHSFRGFRQEGSAHRAKNQDDQHQSSRISKVSPPGASKYPPPISESNRGITSPFNKSKSNAMSKGASAPPLAMSLESLASGQKKTNFAGDGWISPHPLSVASIDVRASPQAAVRLSTDALGQSGTLTYEEWKARRDEVVSLPGSYAPSHMPSAVVSQTSPVAYNHQPPAVYIGSHHKQVSRGSRRTAQTHSYKSQGDHQDTPAPKKSDAYSPHSLQKRACSDLQGVTNTERGSIYKALSGLSRDAGWSSAPKSRDSGSGKPAPYTVGITSTELGDYQQRLGAIVRRYSSHLSLLRAEQAPPQPDYDKWNSRQSHGSKPSLPPYSAHQSYHSEFTVSKNQALGPQSDLPPSRTSSLSGPTDPEWLQPEGSISGSRYSAHAPKPLVVADPYGDNVTYAPSLFHSPPAVQASPSQVTYGTNEWQDLENAEEGRGRYEDSKMWSWCSRNS